VFEDFKDAPKQELFQTLVLSQILGKILKTEALRAVALQRAREHRRPVVQRE